MAVNWLDISPSGVQKAWTVQELKDAVAESTCAKQVCMKLGYKGKIPNDVSIKRYIIQYNIDVSHWPASRRKWLTIHGQIHKYKPRAKVEDVFIENSTYTNLPYLASRLRRSTLISYTCATCGLEPIWQEKELVLQMDHINGNVRDNRLENLRFLCPNCHTQTETWAGKKNKGRQIRKARKDRSPWRTSVSYDTD